MEVSDEERVRLDASRQDRRSTVAIISDSDKETANPRIEDWGFREREGGEEGFRSMRVQGFNVGFQGRVAPIISRAFRPICKRTGLIRPWS